MGTSFESRRSAPLAQSSLATRRRHLARRADAEGRRGEKEREYRNRSVDDEVGKEREYRNHTQSTPTLPPSELLQLLQAAFVEGLSESDGERENERE